MTPDATAIPIGSLIFASDRALVRAAVAAHLSALPAVKATAGDDGVYVFHARSGDTADLLSRRHLTMSDGEILFSPEVLPATDLAVAAITARLADVVGRRRGATTTMLLVYFECPYGVADRRLTVRYYMFGKAL